MTNASDHINLDETQFEAVRAAEPHVLVVGAPGTGKSLVLHALAAVMLTNGVPTQSIFYVTPNGARAFDLQNGAFAEELGRLTGRVSREAAQSVRILSVLRLAHRWLRRYGAAILGMSADYAIWGPQESESTLRELLKAGTYRSRISDEDLPDIVRWHRRRRSSLPETDFEGIPALWPEIIALYEEEKRRRNVLDEEDLVPLAIRSMEGRPDVLRDWRSQVAPRLLVDDFQNLTPVEYRLLQLLAGPDGSFAAAGDPNQSVGAGRGAELGLLARFRNDYPGCKQSYLPFNHRSTKALNAFATNRAKALLSPRFSSQVRPAHSDSDQSPGAKPRVIAHPGSQDGADRSTAEGIHQAHSDGLPWQDIALLCRRRSSIDRLAEVPTSHGIPNVVQYDDSKQRAQNIGDRVTLSTFHAAQGQQWPFVWIADIADHIVPGPLGLYERPWLEEEKRLFYIPSTRAAKALFFSWCTDSGRALQSRFLSRRDGTIEVLDPAA